ncbi:PssD/Cps14F family polysaccharide biosynthesis glycosyltransferase [Methanosarcina siciliae]|uniref:PssD/Cps14F family polysaccharide biosynthesis glycosyltransferase n=1 Tax=Methanosarcina siciliae TaxID=38027 RepID=UPI00064E56E8|nr:PssD/Cps14F family polysaccharide biosynthesis glycosyltransferase [Methanosarcina siciliae]
MKICLTCSHGGHLTEILRLMDAFNGNDIFFITYRGLRSNNLEKVYLLDNLGKNPIRLLTSLPVIYRILSREKPDLIVSTGAEISIPTFYIAKLFGIKLVFIETICRVTQPTISGKLLYPIVDLFLVQQKELLKYYGKKARYEGGVY